jgi:large subunit ribosomal protein L5
MNNLNHSNQSVHFMPDYNRLKLYYNNVISNDLLLKNNYRTILEIPSLNKITIHTTSNRYGLDKKNIIAPLLALELISSQKSKLTRAKKSLASFKIRKNQVIGCKVTLRGNRMYNFLNLFTSVVLPSLREFSGYSKNYLNKEGNLSLGFFNILVFPQLQEHFDYFQAIQGININFSTKQTSFTKNCLLYSAFQLPLI